jgi:hypothetical protein
MHVVIKLNTNLSLFHFRLVHYLSLPVTDGSHLPRARPLLMHRNKMEPTPWFLHNLYSSSYEDMAVSCINQAN